MSNQPRDPGSGPLGQLTGTVYWYLVIGALFVLTTAPGTVPMFFLEQHISNAPLYALFLLPVAPAFSALLYAIARRDQADGMVPARCFFRGYKLNALDALKLWIPASVVLVILAINLGNLQFTGMGSWYPVVSVTLAVAVVVWLLVAVMITSLYNFRTWDTARLAFSFLFTRPIVTIGVLGVVAICVLIVVFTFDAVLALLAWAVAGLLLNVTKSLRHDIETKFLQSES